MQSSKHLEFRENFGTRLLQLSKTAGTDEEKVAHQTGFEAAMGANSIYTKATLMAKSQKLTEVLYFVSEMNLLTVMLQTHLLKSLTRWKHHGPFTQRAAHQEYELLNT